MEKKKIGRPTNNPKGHSFHIRLDDMTNKILSAYCEKHGVSKAEGIRQAIILLEGK